jgi:hypothetical protein
MKSKAFPFPDDSQLRDWHLNIQKANRNNILCHCRNCDYEWVDSHNDVACCRCGSQDVENVSCWQFPDD